ncbi:MAG: RNA-directed DNA polymerase [Chlorobiaceae bacterium]|nr:RNA-directed DNA polymerase [Chlorobiaceae bacterium]
MDAWSVHHLYENAKNQRDMQTAASLRDYAAQLRSSGLPVIFTLGHLAKIVGVETEILHETVNRQRESANYRMYAVAKRSGGRRFIHAVTPELFRVQQYLHKEILCGVKPHPAAFAFHSSGGIRQCASQHCGARWLFQYDLKDFFYEISEVDVYRIFNGLGYRKLLSFEIARLCTTTRLPISFKRYLRASYSEKPNFDNVELLDDAFSGYLKFKPYLHSQRTGVLPQGAPSSPMLSNLAARHLDESLHEYAFQLGFVYTRYADDISISAYDLPSKMSRGDIHRAIVHRIRKARFLENEKKTRIAGPGSKKLVLGLLVDGDSPRLSKETYMRIDRLLYAANKYGLVNTAKHENFYSAYGFYNHLSGLVAFVKDVDIKRWAEFKLRLSELDVPWETT